MAAPVTHHSVFIETDYQCLGIVHPQNDENAFTVRCKKLEKAALGHKQLEHLSRVWKGKGLVAFLPIPSAC